MKLVLNTRAPQGCVLSQLLFTLYNHDCTPRHREKSIVKYANDTTTISITNTDESSYWEEREQSTAETNTLIVDFRMKEAKTNVCLLRK